MGDGFEQIGVGAGLRLAQEGLHLAPHHFDGVEVRGVGRQETGFGTGLPDQLKGKLIFVGAEDVEDDDIAGRSTGRRISRT